MLPNIESIHALGDAGEAAAVPDVFTAQLSNAPSVKGTFFPDVAPSSWAPGDPEFIDRVACAMVCSAIGRSQLYGFSATVDAAKSQALWSGEIDSDAGLAAGRKIYQDLFNLTLSSYTFSETINGRAYAAQGLAAYVTTPQYINVMMGKLAAREPNWLDTQNLVLFKLHLLNDALIAQVLTAWRAAYPDFQETWRTRRFFSAKQFATDRFIGEVNAVISRSREESNTSDHPTGGAGASSHMHTNTTTFFGESVVDFLRGKPAALQLATGAPPQNVQTSHT